MAMGLMTRMEIEQEELDRKYLARAFANALLSNDPNTWVGSVILGADRKVISTGFNSFPRGIAETPERMNDRETKLKLIVHAEMNAILRATRAGNSTAGATLYLAATDSSGMIWGRPPCTRCVVEIIQAGITTIVSWAPKAIPSRWHADLATAGKLLAEAGINYYEYAT